MTAIDIIKTKMKNLYETNPDVHVNVSIATPKTTVFNEPAVIKAVYPQLFRIEDKHGEMHTMKYTDLLTKNIEIQELNLGIS